MRKNNSTYRALLTKWTVFLSLGLKQATNSLIRRHAVRMTRCLCSVRFNGLWQLRILSIWCIFGKRMSLIPLFHQISSRAGSGPVLSLEPGFLFLLTKNWLWARKTSSRVAPALCWARGKNHLRQRGGGVVKTNNNSKTASVPHIYRCGRYERRLKNRQ